MVQFIIEIARILRPSVGRCVLLSQTFQQLQVCLDSHYFYNVRCREVNIGGYSCFLVMASRSDRPWEPRNIHNKHYDDDEDDISGIGIGSGGSSATSSGGGSGVINSISDGSGSNNCDSTDGVGGESEQQSTKRVKKN